jgi:integrase
VAEAATSPRPVGKEIKPLSRQQVRSLLAASRGDKLHAFYVLAVTTGARNGELLALQWRDVDLDAGTLQIRLTGFAVAALREHRLATARQRISEWVFPSRAGTPLSVHNVHNRSWKPLLRRAGLPSSTRMHDLRHTCATLLLGRGVPVKVVSEMLGHGDVAITLGVYQSVLPDMQESAAKAMEDTLGGPADDRGGDSADGV